MIYFTILSAIILIFYPISQKKYIDINKVKTRSNSTSYIVIISTCLIIMLGLRGVNVGIDTPYYYNSFNSMAHFSLNEVIQRNIEIGFSVFQYIISRLFGNFYIFNTIVAAMYVGVVSYIIKKYSSNPVLSYLFFIFFGFYSFAMSATRQTLAITLTLIAFDFIRQRKLWKFIFFCLLAVSFHSSAIVFLPAYWFNKLKVNRKTLLLFLFIGVALIFLKDQVRMLLNSYARLQYSSIETGGQNMYIFFVISLILGILYRKSFVLKSESNKYLLYMIIATVILMPITQFHPAVMRLYFYYSIFQILYIPNLLYSIKDKAIRSIGSFLYVSVGAIWFFSSVLYSTKLVNYLFFWQ